MSKPTLCDVTSVTIAGLGTCCACGNSQDMEGLFTSSLVYYPCLQ